MGLFVISVLQYEIWHLILGAFNVDVNYVACTCCTLTRAYHNNCKLIYEYESLYNHSMFSLGLNKSPKKSPLLISLS